MELSKVTAAFFLRFSGKIDKSMRAEDMRLYDTFNAGPTGAMLLLRLVDQRDDPYGDHDQKVIQG